MSAPNSFGKWKDVRSKRASAPTIPSFNIIKENKKEDKDEESKESESNSESESNGESSSEVAKKKI